MLIERWDAGWSIVGPRAGQRGETELKRETQDGGTEYEREKRKREELGLDSLGRGGAVSLSASLFRSLSLCLPSTYTP